LASVVKQTVVTVSQCHRSITFWNN